MTKMIVEELVTTALGLSGPEALALKLGAMVVADLLKRPQVSQSADSSILSSTPGRVRLSAPGLKGSAKLARRIEERLGQLPGVEKVSASTLTSTALVTFDPHQIDATAISRALRLSGLALRVVLPAPEYRIPSPEISPA